MSRYGRMSCSRMLCQMMRVISSPSISTTGFFTLILLTRDSCRDDDDKCRMQNAKRRKGIQNPFCILHSAFCILARPPVRKAIVAGARGQPARGRATCGIDEGEIPVFALVMFGAHRHDEQLAVRRPVRIIVPPCVLAGYRLR